jgi:hypothetical protein
MVSLKPVEPGSPIQNLEKTEKLHRRRHASSMKRLGSSSTLARLPNTVARRAAAANDASCCAGRGCYKAHHLRLVGRVPAAEVNGMVTELRACEQGLTREDLVRLATTLADRGAAEHARGVLKEFGRRGMRPSLVAHNALLEAYARDKRWDQGMRCPTGPPTLARARMPHVSNSHHHTCALRCKVPASSPAAILTHTTCCLWSAAACSCACSSLGCSPTSRVSQP